MEISRTIAACIAAVATCITVGCSAPTYPVSSTLDVDNYPRTIQQAITPATVQSDSAVNRAIVIRHTDGTSSRCTAAFTADDTEGNHVAVTSGHCIKTLGDYVYRHGAPTSTVMSSDKSYRASATSTVDYGTFQTAMTNNVAPHTTIEADDNTLSSTFRITSVEAPLRGMPVCSYGSTSGWRCGIITRVEETFFVVAGLLTDNGDSGGGAYYGNSVVGITSAANSDTTFFQRADVVMEREGLTLN